MKVDGALRQSSPRRPLWAGALLLTLACGAPEAPGASSAPARIPVVTGSQVHAMPWRDPLTRSSLTPYAAANAHLTYYGGHVISNVKVYTVAWGSNVNTAIFNQLGGFFSTVTNSPLFDWLNEYNTPTNATNQRIGRGTWVSNVTIAPAATGTTITDAQIQNEVASQVASGGLPGPDADTLYMLYFPPGTTITQGNTSSCVAGGFCAYHGTIQIGGQSVYYGVMPDNGPGSGCDRGCGTGTQIQNMTAISSHELIEAVTDAEVGIAQNLAAPLGWYDNTNGEIGDICEAATGDTQSITGENGSSYIVQTEWSNTAGACITTRTAADDFSVALGAPTGDLVAGGSVTVPVTTHVTAGSPGTLTLTAAQVPSGVQASFQSATLAAGASTTLTLTAGASLGVASAVPIVVDAAGPSHHTASALVNLKPAPASDFSLSVSAANATLVQGSSASLTLSSTILKGAATALTVSFVGLPSGVTAAASPATFQSGGSTTITLQSSGSAALPSGPVSMQIQAASAAVSHSAPVALQLVAPAVKLEAPGGSSVSGTVTLSGTATVSTGNTSGAVQIQIDSAAATKVASAASFSQAVNTRALSNGPHTVTATLAEGNATATTSLTLNVQNTGGGDGAGGGPNVVKGGCSATGTEAPAWAALALLGLWAGRRRSRAS